VKIKEESRVLKNKSIQIRDEVIAFIENKFPEKNEIDIQLALYGLFRHMKEGQARVLKEVFDISESELEVIKE
jgi:hypothetical protein